MQPEQASFEVSPKCDFALATDFSAFAKHVFMWLLPHFVDLSTWKFSLAKFFATFLWGLHNSPQTSFYRRGVLYWGLKTTLKGCPVHKNRRLFLAFFLKTSFLSIFDWISAASPGVWPVVCTSRFSADFIAEDYV